MLLYTINSHLPILKAIVDRIHQIERESADMHWEVRTKTRPLQLPGNG